MPASTPAWQIDRAHDLSPGDPRAVKPPVLARATLRNLYLMTLAVIIYGTVGPIGLGNVVWYDFSSAWRWLPASGPTDANDLFTNFVVYLPVGIALRLLLRRRDFAGWRDFLAAGVLAALLSYATEFLQQFMPARSANLVDVFVNTGAAVFGAALAPALQRAVRRHHVQAYQTLRSAPWQVLGWGATILIGALMTQPWMIRTPSIDLTLFAMPDSIDLRRVGMFAIVGLVLTIAGARERGALYPGVRLALWRASWLAVGLEAAQLVLVGHVCSPREAILAIGGTLIGTLLAIRLIASGRIPLVVQEINRLPERRGMPFEFTRLRPLAAVLLLALMGYLLLPAITMGSTSFVIRTGSEYAWLPFHAHFHASFYTAIADMFEQTVIYAAVVLLCYFLRPDVGRWLSFGVLASTITLVQLAGVILRQASFDLTAPVIGAFAWLAACYLWRVMQPMVRPGFFPEADQPPQFAPAEVPATTTA